MRRSRAFVAGDVQVDSVSREVTLSKIFAWFAPDFEDAGGALATAIQYMPENDGVRLWLEQHRESVTVKFRPYDWHLNTSILTIRLHRRHRPPPWSGGPRGSPDRVRGLA